MQTDTRNNSREHSRRIVTGPVQAGAWMLVLLCFAAPGGANESGKAIALFDGKTLKGWKTLDGKPVTRGWKEQMHFIDYRDLTNDPEGTLTGIYRFLEIPPHAHNFQHFEQVTVEDDFVYGFKDLHIIRPKVEPQPSQWESTYDETVFKAPMWKNIEAAAEFWKAK